MKSSRTNCRGTAILEFTLVGIPILFTLIAIFEISRGMWLYATLAHCVRDAARYVAVHGSTCSSGQPACASRVSDVAGRIRNAGVGLIPEHLTVTLSSATRTIGPATLDSLLTNTTYFPAAAPGASPQDAGSEPGQLITVSASYTFASAICLFWPGAQTTPAFATVDLPAAAQGRIEF
jgi:Flp pilus assembly protein TadG